MVVVGGGVVGASVAFHLARSGAATVLADNASRGQATGAAAGILSSGDRFAARDAMLQLVGRGNAYYPELIGALDPGGDGAALGYARCGAIELADSAQDLREVAAEAERRHEAGLGHIGEAVLLSPAEVASECPIAGGRRPGLLLRGAGRVDGGALRDALLAGAASHGATRVSGRAVLEPSGSGWRLSVGSQTFTSPVAVIAAGAWSARIAAGVGAELRVSPQRGQALELVSDDTAAVPSLLDDTGYVAALQKGTFVAGATHEDGVGFARSATLAGLAEIASQALGLAPGLAGARPRRVRVGFRPVTPDGVPILGEVEGRRGLFAATGTGSYGLQAGPYMGRLMAQLIAGQEPEIDLRPFSAQRFGSPATS